jgi:hypothetical protein
MGVDGCANYFDFATAVPIQAAINLALGHGHWILRNDMGEQARKAALPCGSIPQQVRLGRGLFCGSASYIEQCLLACCRIGARRERRSHGEPKVRRSCPLGQSRSSQVRVALGVYQAHRDTGDLTYDFGFTREGEAPDGGGR